MLHEDQELELAAGNIIFNNKNDKAIFEEVISQEEGKSEDYIPVDQYTGQTVWNGERFVTPEEWKTQH